MNILMDIALGFSASIIFYFIELTIIRKFTIADIKGLHELDIQEKNDNKEKFYILTLRNESKREAFNVRVFVEFLNNQNKPTGYSEKRDFPYIDKMQEKVYFVLFSNIRGDKKQESLQQLFEKSKKVHVVITSQNRYGKTKKTDDYVMEIQGQKEPILIFDV